MKKNFSSFCLFLSCLSFLNGCSVVPNPGEPPKKFTLESLPPQVTAKKLKQKVMVDIPNLYPPIDNQRIGVVPEEHRIDYYADCEWGDRLGILLQDVLIYSLQSQNLFSGVTRTYDGMAPDLLLKTDVRKFFIVQKPSPIAVVQYYIQMIRLTDRQVICQQIFEVTLPLTNETFAEISLKLNQANTQALHKIVAWLRDQLQ